MIDLKGFEKYLYEEELSENTIEAYMRGVRDYSKLHRTITKPFLIDYKQKMIEKYSPKTVNLRITAMLRYCEYKDIPMKLKQVKTAKQTYVENVITESQYKKLMNHLKTDDELWYYNILLIAKTGMRISEALKITKKDIIEGKVTIYTKAHMRTIYFPKSLQEEILLFISDMKADEIVMHGHHGKALTSRGVSEALQRFAKKYKISKEVMHPHSFRHFFAQEFVKRNKNIALLADILGHSDVKMTQLYLRQSQKQQKNAVDSAVNW